MQTIDKSSGLLRLNHLDDWAVLRESGGAYHDD